MHLHPLQVFLGLHNARDKRLATNRSVEEILLHPSFQPENYNNDIALVKLREEAELNKVIHPICLPPPQSKVGHILPDQLLLLLRTTKNLGQKQFKHYQHFQVYIEQRFLII